MTKDTDRRVWGTRYIPLANPLSQAKKKTLREGRGGGDVTTTTAQCNIPPVFVLSDVLGGAVWDDPAPAQCGQARLLGLGQLHDPQVRVRVLQYSTHIAHMVRAHTHSTHAQHTATSYADHMAAMHHIPTLPRETKTGRHTPGIVKADFKQETRQSDYCYHFHMLCVDSWYGGSPSRAYTFSTGIRTVHLHIRMLAVMWLWLKLNYKLSKRCTSSTKNVVISSIAIIHTR